MLVSHPFQIGIIACPGGENFAKEIISYLRIMDKRRRRKDMESLQKKFGFTREELEERISFHNNIAGRGQPHSEFQPASDYEIKTNFVKFTNGEFKTEILSSIRGRDIYIVQDTANQQPLSFYQSRATSILSVNDHIFCMLVTIDAALQAGARRVTLVLPTYPYSRQHKKQRREGLTAARFGQMVEYMGVQRIITLDIHSKEIENCFNHLRLENLHASYQIMKVLKDLIDLNSPDLVIVSPDTGAVDRNRFYASSLKKPLGLLYKERDYSLLSQDAMDNNIKNMRLLGSVEGKDVFLCDDILGTGGTVIKAMRFLNEMGARRVICAISLPFFDGEAIEHFEKAYQEGLFYRIIGTNGVFHSSRLLSREWYISVKISKLFAKSITRLHCDLSLSTLLDNRKIIEMLLESESRRTETPHS